MSAGGRPMRLALMSSCTRTSPRASDREQSWLSDGKRPPPSFGSSSWPTRARRRARLFRLNLCKFKRILFWNVRLAHVGLARPETHTWPNLNFESDIIPIHASLTFTFYPPPSTLFHLPTHYPLQTHSLEFPSTMSSISLKVELPAHSHSFRVQVPESSSIANIKSEIFKSCPGGPKVEGQRLIYAGRLLHDDEQIRDIWPVSCPHTTRAIAECATGC